MKNPLIISIILVIVAIAFVGLFILGDYLNQPNDKTQENKTSENNNTESQTQENLDEIEKVKQTCIELGCESGSVYIGSVNSDKFYKCTCRWAETISPENIICFKTRQEALNQNRTESKC